LDKAEKKFKLIAEAYEVLSDGRWNINVIGYLHVPIALRWIYASFDTK